MVSIETLGRKQKATYWPSGTTYTDTGQLKVQAAIEIDVRWEDRQQEALDGDGNTIRVDAVVVVDRNIAVGSMMWLGEKADWADGEQLNEVVSFDKVPNLKATRYRRVVGLIRYSDSLPPLE